MPKLVSALRNTVFFDQICFLNDLCTALSQEGFGDMINLDFSVVNKTDYYNGIVFKGFVEGVPSGILSGGQYDRLMEKMGCRAAAIGFAVYLDALQGILSEKKEFDVDAVLLYSDIDSVSHVEKAVKALRKEYEIVVCQKEVPKKLRYRKLFELCDSGVKSVE
jgi:ATP phosphoribosyltransferase regulatory subunit